MNPTALIVFDLDGVLIDVSRSYRETVRQTARLFFKGTFGWPSLPDPLFSLSDLARVKESGGLNNDWDLTAVVVSLMCTLVDGLSPPAGGDPWPAYRARIAHGDVTALGRFLKTHDAPLSRLMENAGKPIHPFVSACTAGDVGSGNILKQIFQEIYLGPGLFQNTYGIPPSAYQGHGLIDREGLLMGPSALEPLVERHILAIATGRPKIEAVYPLHRFGIQRFFSAVLTLDDCLQEEQRRLLAGEKRVSLSKPHPFMLNALKATFENKVSHYYYVGDMPDDMTAAVNADGPFLGIGVTMAAPDKAALANALGRAGAAHVIHDVPSFLALMDIQPD